MQSMSEREKVNQWLATAVSFIIIGVAIVLFGAVISRMGLLDSWGRGDMFVPNGTLQITAQNMRFGQAEIQVQAGQPVTLALDNNDLYGHSFDVDELDIHVVMGANGRATATFTPTEPGTYPIYCGIPGHREAGMVSTLVVEP